MAFTRKWLEEILQDDGKTAAEKAGAIMDGHLAVTEPLKEERNGYKEQAEKLPGLQKQLEKLEEDATKFDDERKAFDDFKKKVEQDAQTAKIEAAYKKLLKEEGYSEKWVERILESTKLSDMKLGEDGNLADEKQLRDAVNEKWSDVKSTISERGATVEKPLNTGKSTMTKAEILAIKDTTERQKAIANNLQLFGKG